MKKTLFCVLATLCLLQVSAQEYVPTAENLAARKQFEDDRFGIFLHWGIYSMFAQGEWYLNQGNLSQKEYVKVADAFYPHRFCARDWVAAIKESGAKYICLTSRHHDGFSMWDTKTSPYNIVNATPFGRDVIKELAEECQKQGIKLHLYYSHLDWGRTDYPLGRTGKKTGRNAKEADYDHYFKFMNAQLTELLTNYGPIGAIWFDGMWDHDEDSIPFDWRLREQYDLIHRLQPACLIGNNHHKSVNPGEDFQMFERDLPGQNTTGWANDQTVSKLPLETCETMNGMWGYKVNDQNYKSTEEIIQLLIKAAGNGANLLMNLGPQPNGELPAMGLQRLYEVGKWMKEYGETIYGSSAGDLKPQEWGATTRKGRLLYVHVLKQPGTSLELPLNCEVESATLFPEGTAVSFTKQGDKIVLPLPEKTNRVDYVFCLKTK